MGTPAWYRSLDVADFFWVRDAELQVHRVNGAPVAHSPAQIWKINEETGEPYFPLPQDSPEPKTMLGIDAVTTSVAIEGFRVFNELNEGIGPNAAMLSGGRLQLLSLYAILTGRPFLTAVTPEGLEEDRLQRDGLEQMLAFLLHMYQLGSTDTTDKKTFHLTDLSADISSLLKEHAKSIKAIVAAHRSNNQAAQKKAGVLPSGLVGKVCSLLAHHSGRAPVAEHDTEHLDEFLRVVFANSANRKFLDHVYQGSSMSGQPRETGSVHIPYLTPAWHHGNTDIGIEEPVSNNVAEQTRIAVNRRVDNEPEYAKALVEPHESGTDGVPPIIPTQTIFEVAGEPSLLGRVRVEIDSSGTSVLFGWGTKVARFKSEADLQARTAAIAADKERYATAATTAQFPLTRDVGMISANRGRVYYLWTEERLTIRMDDSPEKAHLLLVWKYLVMMGAGGVLGFFLGQETISEYIHALPPVLRDFAAHVWSSPWEMKLSAFSAIPLARMLTASAPRKAAYFVDRMLRQTREIEHLWGMLGGVVTGAAVSSVALGAWGGWATPVMRIVGVYILHAAFSEGMFGPLGRRVANDISSVVGWLGSLAKEYAGWKSLMSITGVYLALYFTGRLDTIQSYFGMSTGRAVLSDIDQIFPAAKALDVLSPGDSVKDATLAVFTTVTALCKKTAFQANSARREIRVNALAVEACQQPNTTCPYTAGDTGALQAGIATAEKMLRDPPQNDPAILASRLPEWSAMQTSVIFTDLPANTLAHWTSEAHRPALSERLKDCDRAVEQFNKVVGRIKEIEGSAECTLGSLVMTNIAEANANAAYGVKWAKEVYVPPSGRADVLTDSAWDALTDQTTFRLARMAYETGSEAVEGFRVCAQNTTRAFKGAFDALPKNCAIREALKNDMTLGDAQAEAQAAIDAIGRGRALLSEVLALEKGVVPEPDRLALDVYQKAVDALGGDMSTPEKCKALVDGLSGAKERALKDRTTGFVKDIIENRTEGLRDAAIGSGYVDFISAPMADWYRYARSTVARLTGVGASDYGNMVGNVIVAIRKKNRLLFGAKNIHSSATRDPDDPIADADAINEAFEVVLTTLTRASDPVVLMRFLDLYNDSSSPLSHHLRASDPYQVIYTAVLRSVCDMLQMSHKWVEERVRDGGALVVGQAAGCSSSPYYGARVLPEEGFYTKDGAVYHVGCPHPIMASRADAILAACDAELRRIDRVQSFFTPEWFRAMFRPEREQGRPAPDSDRGVLDILRAIWGHVDYDAIVQMGAQLFGGEYADIVQKTAHAVWGILDEAKRHADETGESVHVYHEMIGTTTIMTRNVYTSVFDSHTAAPIFAGVVLAPVVLVGSNYRIYAAGVFSPV